MGAMAETQYGVAPARGADAARPRSRHPLVVDTVLLATALAALLLGLERALAASLVVMRADLVGPVPVWALLVLVVPLAAWLNRHVLVLPQLSSAVVVPFDASALAFVLWASAAAGAADACSGGCSTTGPATSVAATGGAVLVAWFLGVAIGHWRHETDSTVQLRIINIALAATSGGALVGLTGLLWAMATPGDLTALAEGRLTARLLVAVVAGSVAYSVVNLLLCAILVAHHEGAPMRTILADAGTALAAGATTAAALAAVLAALLAVGNPWSVALLAPILGALVHAARSRAAESIARERSAGLYRAAAASQRCTDATEVMTAIASAAELALSAPVRWGVDRAGEGQVEAAVLVGERRSWLVAGPRPSPRSLEESDAEVLGTMAALASQALSRIETVDQIRRTAETDSLTGLAVRAVLRESTRAEVGRGSTAHGSASPSGPISMVFADVDHFKAINDEHGHRAGDDVLIEVARRMRATVRPGDVVARLGGDEFAILLPGADERAADEVRRRLAEAFAAPHPVSGRDLVVALSLGCATWRSEGCEDAERCTDWLLEQADRAMYDQKQVHRRTEATSAS